LVTFEPVTLAPGVRFPDREFSFGLPVSRTRKIPQQLPPWLSWQSARLLTDRSLVRSQAEAPFWIQGCGSQRFAWWDTSRRVALVAQMVERKTLNLVVVGSSPTEGVLLHVIAALAQLGERQTEDLKVPGSIPGGGILVGTVPPTLGD
jgi:hypothetical protein